MSNAVAKQQIGAAAADVLLSEHDAAATRLDETGNRAEQGGFAGPIGPDQTDEVTLLDGEIDAAQDVTARSVAGDDMLAVKQHPQSPR